MAGGPGRAGWRVRLVRGPPIAQLTPSELAAHIARQYWEDYRDGQIYPAAFCALRTWQDLTGHPYDPETGGEWPACPPDIAAQLSAQGYTPEAIGYTVADA